MELGSIIQKPILGNRYVIPDIHGLIKTFRALLEKIRFSMGDQLFLLGDYIDRGPDSGAVLDLIMDLQKKHFQVYPIKGNHEEMLLETILDEKRFLIHHLKINDSLNMLEDDEIPHRYIQFLKSLPLFYETPDFIFVHGGINMNDIVPLLNADNLLYSRKTIVNNAWLGNRRVVHGHDPKSLPEIQQCVENKSFVIPLDNGAVYAFRRHRKYPFGEMGNLCALNLDSFQLILQYNIDATGN